MHAFLCTYSSCMRMELVAAVACLLLCLRTLCFPHTIHRSSLSPFFPFIKFELYIPSVLLCIVNL